jgi:hypothetical protein
VRFAILIWALFIFTAGAFGQTDSLKAKNDSLPDRYYVLQEIERNGVKMPEIEIKEVMIHARYRPGKERREYRQYEKLISNIKKVYPYALIVRAKLVEVNSELQNYPDGRERKRYLRDVEKDVFAKYQKDIEDMTISQGRLLIKLIDRETQNTSYVLIRDYRGKFSASFWQGIARIFGTNLKEEYDPYGEDALIEAIINEIDAGRL